MEQLNSMDLLRIQIVLENYFDYLNGEDIELPEDTSEEIEILANLIEKVIETRKKILTL